MSKILALMVDKTKPVRRGQDYLWQVIRELTATDRDRQVFLSEIMNRMGGTDTSAVKLDLARIVKAGLMEPDVSIAGACWRVVRRPTKLPPLSKDGLAVRSGQSAMWLAMRALKSFDATELSLASSTEERRVTLETAKSYLRRLDAAGYLAIKRPAKKGPGSRLTVYRLKPSMDTGPEAPRILRTHLVYDPNRNEVMGLAETEDQP